MALSSNSNAGSTETKVGAGALSNFNTENKSNGNFSGGDINFDTNKLSINNPFNTKESQQPTFNTDDVFKPTLSGNLDIDLPKTNNNSSSSNNTTYSNNSNEPTMTVDEVYGKSNNQPVVEKQGDYSASSNEKSNVETSTFGKQDEVSVTPTSVTENKGMVGNAAIQSVEGLDFQQKDKASVDVLDSKKKRDEVEAEDRADSMRNKIKAGVNNVKQEEGGEDFRIGDRDEDVANAKAEVDRLANEKAKYEKEQKKNAEVLKTFYAKASEKEQAINQEEADYQAKLANNKQLDAIGQKMQELSNRYQEIDNMDPIELDKLGVETFRLGKQLGFNHEFTRDDGEVSLVPKSLEEFQAWESSLRQEYYDGLKDFSQNSINAYKAGIDEEHLRNLQQYIDELDSLKADAKQIEQRQEKLQGLIANNKKKSTAANEAYNNLVNSPEPEPTPQSGAEDEDVANAKAKADEAAQAYKDLQAQADSRLAELNEAANNLSKAEVAVLDANKSTAAVYTAMEVDLDDLKSNGTVTLSDGSEITTYTYVGKDPSVKAAYDARIEAVQNLVQADRTYVAKKSEYGGYVNRVNNAKTKADKALADYKSMVNETFVETPTPQSNAETSYNDAMSAIENSADATPEQKAQAEEVLTDLKDSRQELEEAAAKARSGNPADLVKYQEALEKYNKNLEKAQKIGNRWTQTDFNEDFTRAVAQANDFRVTLADGTEMEYSDFATEEATKSPQYAKAMYDTKAQEYEDKAAKATGISKGYYRLKAKIERWKAEMSQTWLGSKFTFADNQVRNQFNQMAKTDMRATYAAYNNVLNDPNATPEQKAEASKSINQAKALMTASAALQASTGFLSGIGDGMDDGVYGTTDPEARNAWQKTVNTVNNFIKITLGLGISPAANKAYQNMYYMAGAKVNESGLFTTDFDSDGFALCQEYGNNAATGMIAGAGELAVGVAMMFNPGSMSSGLNLIADSVQTFLNGLYGVRNEAEKSQKYTQEVLEYFKEAEDIAESSGNEEAVQEITNAITQIENFELKADEVGNLDNWLEGSGSNTTSNEKFNQSLTYDEWLKLIEADPTMREYAKSLTEKKKDRNAQKDNADAGVNS